MKKIILLSLLLLVQFGLYAQELTVSDVQNSDCLGSTRAEVKETIILTKEGGSLLVQLFNYEANCAAYKFNITPVVSRGSNSEPYSVSIRIGYQGDDADCICPYNISFTLHGLETNSFFFSCCWYQGQINLTEGEPLVLGDIDGIIMEEISIDGFNYTLERITNTARLVSGPYGNTEGRLSIPSQLTYKGQKYSVTSIGEYAFAYRENTPSITIPNSVTSIKRCAFYHCEGLTSIVIGSGVTSINDYVFSYCDNLTDVYCYAENVPETGNNVFKETPISSATLHVPAGSLEAYKAKAPWKDFGTIVGIPEEYYPEGTKWTEIRLDTLKYNSWYSKVGEDWVPNFETIEYRVQGECTAWDEVLKKVYSNGPEWTDSLAFLLLESRQNVEMTVIADGYALLPGVAYQFNWSVGKGIYYRDILESNSTGEYPIYLFFGVIDEIKEGDFGGVRPLKYVDLDGKAPDNTYEYWDWGFTDARGGRIIQGIGITEWNDGECLFGPPDPYYAGYGWRGDYKSRHYRSMLVHFERNNEVLYDVWPKKEIPSSITVKDAQSANQGTLFDLQGRMIAKPQKGIYIKNGKKILIK